MPSELAELVARARAGQRPALEELARLAHKRVFALGFHMLGPEAEDAAQDALLRICTRLGDLRDPERFWSWALRVAGNYYRDLLRKRSLRSLSLDDVGELVDGCDPARSAENGEVRGQVLRALSQLSLPLRLVVVLRDAEGFSTQEVADALSVPEGTVKSRLFEARRLLRESLVGCLD